jgi:FAD:protein FMN transferase
VAVERPDHARREAFGVIELADRAVATSGDYRHWVDVGRARLSHTMDPRRGGPAKNRVASASVLHSSCMEADAWATALMVAGEDAGPALARERGLDALFLLRDGIEIRQFGVGPVFEEVQAATA